MHTLVKRASLLFMLAICTVPCLVSAETVVYTGTTVAPAAEPDVTVVAKTVWEAVNTGNWGVVMVGVLMLAVWAVRTYGKNLPWGLGPKLDPFLQNALVAYCLPVVLSMGGAVISGMLAGQPAMEILAAGMKVAIAAVWAYVGLKKVQEVRIEAKAKADGQIKTTADALAALSNPVPPPKL